MAKRSTTKTSKPKTATAASKSQDQGGPVAAKPAAPVEKVQNAKDLPTQADTPRQKRDKLQAIFDKADEAGKAEIIETTRRTNAALGGL